jgi:hypothetical protein
MANLLEKTGKVVFLRAHDLGTGFGPPNDQLDVEAVFSLNAISDGAMGFQLRNDDKLPARQAMFSLLRDAFANDLPVTADFFIDPGKKNGTAIRIALTRSHIFPKPPIAVGPVISGKVAPAPEQPAPSGAGKTRRTAKKARRNARTRKSR